MAHLKGTAASPVDLGDPISTQDRDLLASTPGRIHEFKSCLGERILGQEETIRPLILCFFAGGHALVVGVPGLAKTLMIRSLAELFELEFARIQFTPDLMPSDITGTSILAKNETTGQREFQFRPGPLLAVPESKLIIAQGTANKRPGRPGKANVVNSLYPIH